MQPAPVLGRNEIFDQIKEKQDTQHASCRGDREPLGDLRLCAQRVRFVCVSKEKRFGGVPVSLGEQCDQRRQFVVCPENTDLPEVFLRGARQQVFQHGPAEHLVYNTRQADDDERGRVAHHLFPERPVEYPPHGAELRR